MYNILTIDTSTDFCFIGLYINKNIFKISKYCNNIHVKVLLKLIDKILNNNNITIKDINIIICINGPGNFVSTKIGVSAVKGLSLGLNIPIICISSLLALAAGSYRINNLNNNILSMIKAYSKLIYWSFFYIKNNSIKSRSGYKLTYPSEIFNYIIKNNFTNKLIYSGSVDFKYITNFLKNDIEIKFSGIKYQSIQDIINLSKKLIFTKKFKSSENIYPIYIK